MKLARIVATTLTMGSLPVAIANLIEVIKHSAMTVVDFALRLPIVQNYLRNLAACFVRVNFEAEVACSVPMKVRLQLKCSSLVAFNSSFIE